MSDSPKADGRTDMASQAVDDSAEDTATGGAEWNALKIAALAGGALAAATAGAYIRSKAIARRNVERDGKPLNSVMATAITACDLSQGASHVEPSAKDIEVVSATGRHDS